MSLSIQHVVGPIVITSESACDHSGRERCLKLPAYAQLLSQRGFRIAFDKIRPVDRNHYQGGRVVAFRERFSRGKPYNLLTLKMPLGK